MAREEKYRKLYESLKEVVARLDDDARRLRDRNSLLEAERRQWEREKAAQQEIIARALNAANERNNAYLGEIMELRKRVAELEAE